MKIISILAIIIFFAGFVACDNQNLQDDDFEIKLLKQVFAEDEVFYEFTYNNADLIVEEKSKFHYTKHNYNKSNQLIQSDYYWDERIASSSMAIVEEAMKRKEWVNSENTEKDSYFTFEYDNSGKLEKRYINRLNGGAGSFDVFSYDNNGRIERRTSFHENKVSLYDVFNYDNKGNLTKQQRFFISDSGTPNLQTTTEYEFDEKHNPYLSFRKLMIPGQNTNPNNIVKETYTIHFEVDGLIPPVQVKEYSYEYNLMDYPVKRSDGWSYVYY